MFGRFAVLSSSSRQLFNRVQMTGALPATTSLATATRRMALIPMRAWSLTTVAGHKTQTSAKKRFIVTGSGNIKYKHAGKKHLNGHKSHARLKALGQTGILHGTWEKKMRAILN